MYVYKWIEGEKQMIDFCQKRFKMKPHFCETIGHCGPATIHLIYKYKDENDRSKGCAQMFFLFMDHPAGPGSNPGGSTTQQQQTMDAYKNKRGEQLKPLNVGPHTWLLVSPDKATKARAEKFRRDCERSQRMAKNIR